MIKVCNKCSEEKDINLFSKDKDKKDGRRTICKTCTRDYQKIKYREPEFYNKKKEYRDNLENKKRKKELDQSPEYRLKQSIRDKREHVKKRKALHLKKRKALDQIQRRKKQRYDNEPLYRLKVIARGRIRHALLKADVSKSKSTCEMLGCTYKQLKKHIESQFTDGMSWKLRGKIHIDHIVPLASAKTEEELIKLCHYTNLQPLWARDNILKSDKIL